MTTEGDLRQRIYGLTDKLRRKSLTAAAIEEIGRELAEVEKTVEAQPDLPRRSIMELEGLGAEIWQGIDVEAYIERERNSWR